MIKDSLNQAQPGVDSASPSRGATRSALTRWVAERNLRNQPAAGAPSYERCERRDCWGKASWTCPSCSQKACSAHRSEHHCSLPYLPR